MASITKNDKINFLNDDIVLSLRVLKYLPLDKHGSMESVKIAFSLRNSYWKHFNDKLLHFLIKFHC